MSPWPLNCSILTRRVAAGVGRRRARYLTVRFSTPPVATVRKAFTLIR